VSDKHTFHMYYPSSQQLSKAMAQAQELAERVKLFTNIEIEVIPSHLIVSLRAERGACQIENDILYTQRETLLAELADARAEIVMLRKILGWIKPSTEET